MDKPLVSIVTLCWNRKEDILESLKGIQEIDYEPLEIIVVDNNSTDGTSEAIEKKFPNVKIIKMFKNIGIEAYNIGFKNAKGEYIVILDDDSFPHSKAIGRMVKKFEQDDKLGMVAFDVRNYYKYDEVTQEDDNEGIQNKAVAKEYNMGFNGAGAGVRRKLFEQIGFYPEEFFLYWNEADTAFRIWNAGYKIEFFADVVSYHKYSPQNRSSSRAAYYYTRNAFYLVWKNYSMKKVMKNTVYLMYKSVYSSLEQHSVVYLKAMFSAFFSIKNLKGKRNPVGLEIENKLRVPLNIGFTFFR